MKSSEVKLPSNKNFGYFFTFIFLVMAGYLYLNNSMTLAYACIVTSVSLFLVSLTKADLLFPLNKLWMRFGILLGMVVSPVVLGVLFFGVFTPIAVLMRLSGRDELRLKFKKKTCYWISRDEPIQAESFKNQF